MSFILLGILNSQVSGAAGGSYELIESQVLSSSASSVTFSSIPQDYKHLQIRATIRGDRNSTQVQLLTTVNSVTTNSYREHNLYGNGSSVASGSYVGDVYNSFLIPEIAALNDTSNAYSALVMDVLDYASSSKNTTFRALHGRTGAYNRIFLTSGAYFGTAAVSTLTFTANANNIIAGSRFSLYGIRG